MNFGRIVVINLLVLLCLLLLSELLLRTVVPLSVSDAARVVVKQSQPGVKRQVLYTRNQFGFRSLSMTSILKKDGSIRIMCLGASTTDNPAQNTEDIWCSLLGKQLSEKIGIEVEAVAMGRGGWRAANLLNWINQHVDTYKPDYIIVLMGINDLSWNGGPNYSYEGLAALRKSGGKEKLPANFVERVKYICKSISHLCRRVDTAHDSLQYLFAQDEEAQQREIEWGSDRLRLLQEEHARRPYVDYPIRNPDPIHEFKDSMYLLAGAVKLRDIPTIIAGQPVLWAPDMAPDEQATLWFPVNTPNGYMRASGDWLLAEMRRYNSVQADIAASHGFKYVDLDKQTPKTTEYYYDDCHFTDLGNQRVAQILVPVLRQLVEENLSNQASAESH